MIITINYVALIGVIVMGIGASMLFTIALLLMFKIFNKIYEILF